MKTVVLGPRSPELDALIARRRALGQDHHDEVWQGEYHMAPAAHHWHSHLQAQLTQLLGPHARARGLVLLAEFNLGQPDDFRVPDLGVVTELADVDFAETAALVVEVVSPNDESWQKFDFYAGHGVDEVLIADPRTRSLDLFRRDGAAFSPVTVSHVLGIAVPDLHRAVDWPG